MTLEMGSDEEGDSQKTLDWRDAVSISPSLARECGMEPTGRWKEDPHDDEPQESSAKRRRLSR